MPTENTVTITLDWEEMEMLEKLTEKKQVRDVPTLATSIVKEYLESYNKKLAKASEKVSELQY